MASGIKGITIELNGDVTKLDQALKGVNATSKHLNAELKDIEKQLKFNPGNTTLLEQQQRALAEQVGKTAEKLDVLKEAARQAQTQLANGQLGQENFDALQREIIATETQLSSYEKRLQASKQATANMEESTKQLAAFFQATERSVESFSGVLGDDLVNAFKEGKASASQLETMIQSIADTFLGAGSDVEKFKTILSQVDDSSDLKKVRSDLEELKSTTCGAIQPLKDLHSQLNQLASIDSLGSAVDDISSSFSELGNQIEDVLSLASDKSKIEVSMNLDKASAQAVQEAVIEVQKYGVEADEALQGVRRQWQLNGEATDAANAKMIEYAGALSNVYSGLDFTELIQETNEVAGALDITNEQAIGLVNSLLEVGFPVDQLDIISEYGTQLEMAGFNAQEVQAIMAAGIETKTWNIDNLLDGLKEGRIRLAEFGQEIPAALQPLIEQAGISAEQMQKWGQAVAEGGAGGRKAMEEVAQALMSVEDETLRNALGAQIFGTMWEDQGENIIDTINGMNDHLGDAAENQEKLNNLVDVINSDPMVALKDASLELMTALLPVADVLADVVEKIADFAAEHPKVTAFVGAIVAGFTTILPLISSVGLAFVALKPAVGILKEIPKAFSGLGKIGGIVTKAMGGMVKILPVVAGAFGSLSGPVGIVVGLVGALVAAAVAVIANWETVGPFLQGIWENIVAVAQEIWGNFTTFFSTIWDTIVEAWSVAWETITTTISELWTAFIENAQTIWNTLVNFFTMLWMLVQEVFSFAWETIKTVVETIWQAIVDAVSTIFGPVVQKFQSIWNSVKSVLETVWNAIKTAASNVFNAIVTAISQKWEQAKSKTSAVWNAVKGVLEGIWNGIKATASVVFEAIVGTLSAKWSAAQSKTSAVWNAIKSAISSAIEAAKSAVSSAADAIQNKVASAFEGAKSKATSAFDALKSGVTNAINAARDAVGNAVKAIKGFFDGLHLRIPEIQLPRLPRIGISGHFSINPPSVPHFYWAAKGGIFDGPQIIGVGEAGKEAVVPLKKLVPLLAEALHTIGVDEAPDGGGGGNININVERMEIRQESDIEAVAKELYRMIERAKRGRGLRAT